MNNKLPTIDQLIELAKNNPEELERLRQRQVNALIASAPEHMQRRLRGLQFQIDCKREIHSSAMGSCLAITRMMMDSLQQLNQALQGLTGEQAPLPQSNTKPSMVIPFPATAN